MWTCSLRLSSSEKLLSMFDPLWRLLLNMDTPADFISSITERLSLRALTFDCCDTSDESVLEPFLSSSGCYCCLYAAIYLDDSRISPPLDCSCCCGALCVDTLIFCLSLFSIDICCSLSICFRFSACLASSASCASRFCYASYSATDETRSFGLSRPGCYPEVFGFRSISWRLGPLDSWKIGDDYWST